MSAKKTKTRKKSAPTNGKLPSTDDARNGRNHSPPRQDKGSPGAILRQFNENFDDGLTGIAGSIRNIVELLVTHTAHINGMETTLYSLTAPIKRLEAIEEKLDGMETTILHLNEQQQAQGENLDFIQNHTESVARKVEQFSREFTKESVEAPLFKEFARLYGAMRKLETGQSEPDRGNTAILEGMEHFLDGHEVTIIWPRPGEKYNPKEHQCLSRCSTEHEAMDGKIAEAFQAGIRRDKRVLQFARVAVFQHEPNHHSQTTIKEK